MCALERNVLEIRQMCPTLKCANVHNLRQMCTFETESVYQSQIAVTHMCGTTHAFETRDVYISVTSLIYIRDIIHVIAGTHLYDCRDSFI